MSGHEEAALDMVSDALWQSANMVHEILTVTGSTGRTPSIDEVYERLTTLTIQLNSTDDMTMVHRYPLLVVERPEGTGVFLQVGVIPKMVFVNEDDAKGCE